MDIGERIAGLVFPGQRRQLTEQAAQIAHLSETVQVLTNAYQAGPFDLPPEELVRQLKQLREYDPGYVDLLVSLGLYEQIGGTGAAIGAANARQNAVNRSRMLWQHSPIGQLAVLDWTAWGLGDGVELITDDEAAQETWDEFWTAHRNDNLFGQDKIQELSYWLLVNGNRFFACYASTVDGQVTIRLIDQDEIEIVAHPQDKFTPWFYKRIFSIEGMGSKVLYYPDWALKFTLEGQSRNTKEEAKRRVQDAWEQLAQTGQVDRNAMRADQLTNGQGERQVLGLLGSEMATDVCMLHSSHWRKDEKSLWGWPLTTVAGAWLVAHKQFLEAQLGVAMSKAQFVRTVTTEGGSRAMASVRDTIRSALSQSQWYDTRPPAAAGSTWVQNKAVEYKDLPMTTGASDADANNKNFAWMAGTGVGMSTTSMGLDAQRYATAVQMQHFQSVLFNTYRQFWATQFGKMCKIVLSFAELYGGASFPDKGSTTSIDALTMADLPGLTDAIARVFSALNESVMAGIAPANAVRAIQAQATKPMLYALGAADVEELTSDEAWGVGEEEEQPPPMPPEEEGPIEPPEEEMPEEPTELSLALREQEGEEEEPPRGEFEDELMLALALLFKREQRKVLQAFERGESVNLDDFRMQLIDVLLPVALDAMQFSFSQYENQFQLQIDDGEATTELASRANEYVSRAVDSMMQTTRDLLGQAERYRDEPERARAIAARAFDESRAQRIGITEVTVALAFGALLYQLLVKRQYGVDMDLTWYTRADERVCPVCLPLHRKGQDIWGQEFPQGPPAHVHCRCGLVARRARRVA